MFGMQTASGVRKLSVRQIRCKAPTFLKRLQTWSLASFKLGRILDPENTVTMSFSTLAAQSGRSDHDRTGLAGFRGAGTESCPYSRYLGRLSNSSLRLMRVRKRPRMRLSLALQVLVTEQERARTVEWSSRRSRWLPRPFA